MITEQSLEKKIEQHLAFLSRLLEDTQPFVHINKEECWADTHAPFCASINFSTYDISLKVKVDESSPEWMDVAFEMKDANGKIIVNRNTMTTSSRTPEEISQTSIQGVNLRRLLILKDYMGQMDELIPSTYDVSTWDLSDDLLKGVRINSIYHGILLDWKQKGKPLPPVLAADPHIFTSMREGYIGQTQNLVHQVINDISLQNNESHLVHVRKEAAHILRHARQRQQYYNPNIPLAKKLEYKDNILVVPGDTKGKKTYNIVVVEDTPESADAIGTLNCLGPKLHMQLIQSNKYPGTTIIPVNGICGCTHTIGTGQVDLVIMDGGHYGMGSIAKMLEGMGGKLESNSPIYDLTGTQEKQIWLNRALSELDKRELPHPKHIIIPKNIMEMDLAEIIQTMLAPNEQATIFKQHHTRQENEMMQLIQEELRIANLCGGHYSHGSYYDHEYMQKYIQAEHAYMLSHAHAAAKVGQKLTLEEFTRTFASLIRTQYPQYLEHVKPTKVLSGLHTIEDALESYPSYAAETTIREALVFRITPSISSAAMSLDDIGFFENLREFGAAANSIIGIYTTLDFLKTRGFTQNGFADIDRIPQGNFSLNHTTLQEKIQNEVIPSIIDIAKIASMKPQLQEAFTGYAKKLESLCKV